MANSFQNIGKIPELRKRILFTLGMLAVYRIGVFITDPGRQPRRDGERHLEEQSGSFLGMFNMFSGGALEQLSIFALGIMPYVSASIIMQLLTVVVPTLDQLNKEGEQGRRKINQYTRYGTIVPGDRPGLLHRPVPRGPVAAAARRGGRAIRAGASA